MPAVPAGPLGVPRARPSRPAWSAKNWDPALAESRSKGLSGTEQVEEPAGVDDLDAVIWLYYAD